MKKFILETKQPPPKARSTTIDTKHGEIEFIPTFNENDMVMVKPTQEKYSKELKRLSNQTLVVSYCKVTDLGDMLTEVIYLKPVIGIEINNPYLVDHFKYANR